MRRRLQVEILGGQVAQARLGGLFATQDLELAVGEALLERVVDGSDFAARAGQAFPLLAFAAARAGIGLACDGIEIDIPH